MEYRRNTDERYRELERRWQATGSHDDLIRLGYEARRRGISWVRWHGLVGDVAAADWIETERWEPDRTRLAEAIELAGLSEKIIEEYPGSPLIIVGATSEWAALWAMAPNNIFGNVNFHHIMPDDREMRYRPRFEYVITVTYVDWDAPEVSGLVKIGQHYSDLQIARYPDSDLWEIMQALFPGPRTREPFIF